MIDKEKLLNFLNYREDDCGDCTVNEIIFIKEEIGRGDFDIEKPKETCKWELNKELENEIYYVTSCGDSFEFNCGDLKDNDFKYCPYCGKETEEVNDAQ